MTGSNAGHGAWITDQGDCLPDDIPREHRRELREYDHVIGTGIGPRQTDGKRTDEPALVLFVDEKHPEDTLDSRTILPSELETPGGDTVRTDVQATGGVPTAQSTTPPEGSGASESGGSPLRRRRIDPMPGGVSIAHPERRGGTASALLYRDGTPVILTAMHIFSENGEDGESLIGEPANQPSPWLNSRSEQIGTVAAAAEFFGNSSRTTTVDAVLIEVNEADVLEHYLGYRDADATGQTRFDQRVVTISSSGGMVSGLLTARDMTVRIRQHWGETITYSGLESYADVTGAGASGSIVGHIDPSTGEFTITGINIAGSPSLSWIVPWDNIEAEFGELRVPAQVGDDGITAGSPTTTSSNTQ